MAALTRLTCDTCHQHADITSALRCYALDDGTEVPVMVHQCWCVACQAVVDAEVIPTLRELDSRATDDRTLLGRWKEWRTGRTGGPRCLHCGSTEILGPPEVTLTVIESDAPDLSFPHPVCGGRFEVVGAGFANVHRPRERYSPEGSKLPLDAMGR